MITGKINVSNIEKARLFKGAKGTYLDIALIPTPDSEYGDYMIVQSVSKEEREAGKRGPILGNAKILGNGQGPRRNDAPRTKVRPETDDYPPETSDDDVPF